MLGIPVGIAHLAQNSVPTSHAGVIEKRISLPTKVDAIGGHINVAQVEGEEYYHFTAMKAQLSLQGEPLDGMTVIFSIGERTLCTSTTNGGGTATCNTKVDVADLPGPVPTKYTVWFAGNGALQSSTVEGSLEKVTGDGNGGNSGNEQTTGSST